MMRACAVGWDWNGAAVAGEEVWGYLSGWEDAKDFVVVVPLLLLRRLCPQMLHQALRQYRTHSHGVETIILPARIPFLSWTFERM